MCSSASGLGVENRNPKLKKATNSRRIGLCNEGPEDDDERDENDEKDVVRSGGAAAIMEQTMN